MNKLSLSRFLTLSLSLTFLSLSLSLTFLSLPFLPLSLSFLPLTSPAAAQDSQTFLSTDNSFRITYPASFTAQEAPSGLFYVIGNDLPAVTAIATGGDFSGSVSTGSIVITIFAPAHNDLFGLAHGASLERGISILTSGAIEQADTITPSFPLQIGNYPALRTDAFTPRASTAFIVLDVNGTLVLTTSLTAPNELPQFETTLLTMLASISLDPTSGVNSVGQSLTYHADGLSFNYPGGWFVQSSTLGYITLTNNPASFDGIFESDSALFGIATPAGSTFLRIPKETDLPRLAYQLTLTLTETLPHSLSYSSPTATSFVGYSGFRVDFSAESLQGFGLVLQINQTPLFFIITSPQLSTHLPTFESIIASLTYAPAPRFTQFGLITDFTLPNPSAFGADENQYWLFDALPGQVYSFALTTTDPTYSLQLLDSTGALAILHYPLPTEFFFTPQTAGTYYVRVSGVGAKTAPYSLHAQRLTPTGTLPLDMPVSADLRAHQDLWLFQATVGDLISLNATSNLFSPTLTLLAPSGLHLGTATASLLEMAPLSGTYLAILSGGTGPYSLTFNRPLPSPITSGDLITNDYLGLSQFFTFTATLGQTLTLTLSQDDFGAQFTLTPPYGRSIELREIANPQITLVLGESGPYTLRLSGINPSGHYAFSFEIH